MGLCSLYDTPANFITKTGLGENQYDVKIQRTWKKRNKIFFIIEIIIDPAFLLIFLYPCFVFCHFKCAESELSSAFDVSSIEQPVFHSFNTVGSQPFLTAGQIWFFKCHGGPHRCRAPSVAFMTDDCVLLRRTRHRLKRSGEVYPVASFEFTRRPPKSASLLSTQAQVHPTWRAPSVLKPHYFPFFSTTTFPNPPRTLNPRYVPFSFYPSLR